MVFNMSGEKIAGGMSYQTLGGIDYNIIEYILNSDNSSEIFQKNKEYYFASIKKIMARLILAKTRIDNVKLKENEALFLNQKISNGIKWLDTLKINIENAKDSLEFQKSVSYKEWHAVKLIPQSAEGYASSILIEARLEKMDNENVKIMKEAHLHLNMANNLLKNLLNSDSFINFKHAEKQLIEAYAELYLAFKFLG